MSSRTIQIFHPVLGVGGAERLMLHLARVLADGGWHPVFVVNRYPTDHAFPEAADFEVRVVEGPVPESPGGRARFLTAWLRLRHAMRSMRGEPTPALNILDLTPHLIPEAKRLWPDVPVLGYCHFPDRFLAPEGGGFLYRGYRRWVDGMERRGWCAADRVLANSEFTRETLHGAVPGLPRDRTRVVYPAVRAPAASARPETEAADVLVLSRFDPRKNQELALDAWSRLAAANRLPNGTRLVLAGGCDPEDEAAVGWLDHLREGIRSRGLETTVDLLPNPDDDALRARWNQTAALLHTARFEHFGLVPLEAMHRGLPVVALDEGGPSEVVDDGVTGLLCRPDAGEVAEALGRVLGSPEFRGSLGDAGRIRARERFGEERFRDEMLAEVEALAGPPA